MQDKNKILDKAKIALMSRDDVAFITTILFSLNFKWDETIPTACVDMKNMIINPTWFCDMKPNQRVGLLYHEAWHVAFDHLSRSNNFDNFGKYNRAADYVINNMAIEQGYELPDGGLVNSDYSDMSTDEIYHLLPEEDDDFNEDFKPTDGSDAQAEEIKNILVKASTAAQMEKQTGTIPNEVQVMLDKLLKPKLDWKSILQKYMRTFAKEDFSYRKFNRRFMPDFYLPTLHSEAVEEIAIAVDTSGSVSQSDFDAFLTEINKIKKTLNPVITKVIDFDTKVNTVHVLKQKDSVSTVSFKGRGGTRLKPVFDYYNSNKPTALIIFSDLYCDPVVEDPGYPVIWVIVDNPNAEVHFGKPIHYSTD